MFEEALRMLKLQGGPKKFPKLFSCELRQILSNLIIFGIQIAKTIELCEVHSFFTLSNLCQRTTV